MFIMYVQIGISPIKDERMMWCEGELLIGSSRDGRRGETQHEDTAGKNGIGLVDVGEQMMSRRFEKDGKEGRFR